MPTVAALRERYGAFALHEEAIPVTPDRFAGFADEQARDALGGAGWVVPDELPDELDPYCEPLLREWAGR